MRLIIAMLKHETNSFSPVRTDLTRFGNGGPFHGPAVVDEFRGTRTPMGAFLDFADAVGADYVTPIAAESMPSGPTSAEVFDQLVAPILEAARQGCDAMLLDLHGAMVSEAALDAEAELLRRLRAILPDTPIGVALDLHANLSQDVVRLATVTNGYKTYPHVDMYETGVLVAEAIQKVLEGKSQPVSVLKYSRILADTIKMGTDRDPMKALVEAALETQAKPGIISATVYGGFPLSDSEEAGLSVLVAAENDEALANREADLLLDLAWKLRQDLIFHPAPLEESIAKAKAIESGPVLLVDFADNCASGGTQDSMRVVEEVMRQGLEDVAVGCIKDPEAVDIMVRAGIGARVTLQLGGKQDMPAIGVTGKSMEVTGVVRAITDGQFTITGPMYTGVRTYMGRTVVLDTGKIQFVVTERNVEPWDAGVFTSVGIVPESKRYLLLKSRVNYRAAFQPMAREIIECGGVGVTTSDLSAFEFKHVRRPIYPMDELTDWRSA